MIILSKLGEKKLMAGNNKIKLLRGHTEDIKKSTEILSEGQPLFDLDTRELYVGDGVQTIKQLFENELTVSKLVKDRLNELSIDVNDSAKAITRISKLVEGLDSTNEGELSFSIETTDLQFPQDEERVLVISNRELSEGAYVDWGDGVVNNVYYHYYKLPGSYTIKYYNMNVVTENMFSYSDQIKSVRIHNAKVESCAFEGITTLKEVTIENSESVGENAFAECISLGYLNLGNCKKIGDSAFKNCKRIDIVDIPYMTEIVGEEAFVGCSNVTHLYIDEGTKQLGHKAFNFGSDKLVDITLKTVPTQLTLIGQPFYASTCPIVVNPVSYETYKQIDSISSRCVSTCLTSYVEDKMSVIDNFENRLEAVENRKLYQYTFRCQRNRPDTTALDTLFGWVGLDLQEMLPQSTKTVTFTLYSYVDCPNVGNGTSLTNWSSSAFKEVNAMLGSNTYTLCATGSDKFSAKLDVLIEIVGKILKALLGKIGGIVEDVLDFLGADDLLRLLSIVPTHEEIENVTISRSGTTRINVKSTTKQYMNVTIPFTSVTFPYYRAGNPSFDFGSGTEVTVNCYKTQLTLI